jgi:hypothetical protein
MARAERKATTIQRLENEKETPANKSDAPIQGSANKDCFSKRTRLIARKEIMEEEYVILENNPR